MRPDERSSYDTRRTANAHRSGKQSGADAASPARSTGRRVHSNPNRFASGCALPDDADRVNPKPGARACKAADTRAAAEGGGGARSRSTLQFFGWSWASDSARVGVGVAAFLLDTVHAASTAPCCSTAQRACFRRSVELSAERSDHGGRGCGGRARIRRHSRAVQRRRASWGIRRRSTIWRWRIPRGRRNGAFGDDH